MDQNGFVAVTGESPPRRKPRGTGPILILAALFLICTFLAWYLTWFGRNLSDADITTYLADTRNPRHVQHALLQVEQKMERGESNVKVWYPAILTLATSNETEFRLTVAWLMGYDNQNGQFHEALKTLVYDPEPIVRRNAALALVRFNDSGGREELASILQPYPVKVGAGGKIVSTLHEGSEVSRGTMLARLQQTDGKVFELRSPLPGKIAEVVKANGTMVGDNETVMTINSDDESVWESLRALAIVGESAELTLIKQYESGPHSERVKQQAALTRQAIESRAAKK